MSRAMTKVEQNAYAQIEKELLAIVFAMERFHSYVYAKQDVTVETDHKPLLAIHKKAMVSAPIRLQRMLLRLQRYTYTLVFKPGSQMVLADALSRAYPPQQDPATTFNEEIASAEQVNELKLIAAPRTIQLLMTAAKDDEQYQLLLQQVQKGWPTDSRKVPPALKVYITFADELTVSGDLVFKGSCVVVPAGARADILDRVHAAHIGVN